MDIHHLVKMANDIGAFFASSPDHEVAVDSIAQHLKSFWDPRMRNQLIEYAGRDDGDLTPLAREAVLLLQQKQRPA
ncbi:MAG TPA: formate dehydrogenase subunit delta [Candidatus Binataceae bacterium]|jgi:formate dehydrogenase subunit delta